MINIVLSFKFNNAFTLGTQRERKREREREREREKERERDKHELLG